MSANRATLGPRLLAAALFAAGAAAAFAQGPGYLPPTQPRQVPPLMVPAPAGPGQLQEETNGSVPAGAVSSQPLSLSLADAIDRGLRTNLAAVLAGEQTDEARAQHDAALSALLPRVDAGAGEIRQKINLAAFGLSFPGIPPIIGPFDVFNANVSAQATLWDAGARRTEHAAVDLQTAAREAQQSTRDVVVLAVANQYLLTLADESRVAAARAQLTTAEQEFTQAQDMKNAGTVDALVVVRAQVQRDLDRQRLLAQQNQLAKQRLQLARVIGLPGGQSFQLTDQPSPNPVPLPDPALAVAQALTNRPDYRAAQAAIAAAQWQVGAARAQRWPTLSVFGDYGPLGRELISNHPVYEAAATVQVPVFEGGLFKADMLSAQTRLHDAEARSADLRAAIDQQVRSALFDAQSNFAQVAVAREADDLAQRELTLARDRFHAGVADNLEVVQAEQSVAEADENLIASLYAFNVAKASLAQALGVAQSGWKQYLQP